MCSDSSDHGAIEALKLRTRCATLPVSRFSFWPGDGDPGPGSEKFKRMSPN